MSSIRNTPVSNRPQEAFEKLCLPTFHQSTSDYDDLPFHNRVGEGSSHCTLTGPPGLKFSKLDRPLIPDVKGAIIYCDGALEQRRFNRFGATTICPLEAAFHSTRDICPLPFLIGLPIWMRPYRHDPNINRANPAATWLHVIADIDSPGFGYVAKTWLDSAVVMRSDGHTLLPQHLEVLSFYCRQVFEEVVGQNVGSAGLSEDPRVQQVQRTTFRKLATKRGFMEFYESYCLEKSMEDQAWRYLPSPYDGDMLRGDTGPFAGQVPIVVGTIETGVEDHLAPRTSGRVTRNTARVRESVTRASSGESKEVRGRGRVRRGSGGE